MHTFQYKAISQRGETVSGTIEAENQQEALLRLRETYSAVVKLSKSQLSVRGMKPAGRIKEKALAVMCSQFSIIIGAGLSMVRAVELIADQTTDKVLKKILNQSAADVAAGSGLAESLENWGPELPVTFIETVRSGEESGTLDYSFRRLQDYYDKSSELKGKVKAAMIYPMFTLIVAAVVVVIIMVVAVPAFTNSFASMGAELPGVTRAMIAMSNFFKKYWILFTLLIIGAIITLKLNGKTEKGKLFQAQQRLKIPVLGRINKMKSSAQFANTMSTLLAAGLPMLRAATITASVLDNIWIGDKVAAQLSGLEEGKTLTSCLWAARVFPNLLCEMVGVGEETGTLENTLDVVGAYYDNETSLASQKALNLLEPIIIVILAVIVGFVLLSVYLPMFSLYGNLS